LNMVVEIKKGSTKEEIDAAFKKLYENPQPPRKPFNAKKFAGKMKRGFDGLEFQRQARNEWE